MALTVSEIRQIAAPIAARYGVDRMYLFGSYARGDNTPRSDVDLRVDKGQARGLQMAFMLSDLEDALRCPVDLISSAALDSAFLDRISREEKLLYDRSGTQSEHT